MAQIDLLMKRATKFYDNGDPGHDMEHIRRVMENCRRIGAAVNADLNLLLPAALLHDVVNIPKNHPDRLSASRMAAEKAVAILRESNYSDEEIEKITTIITEHSYSLAKKPTSIESAVLQDADKLDALGAIGIMRTVTCGAKMGASYYDANDLTAERRDLNDKQFTIDHFFTKLLKLPDLMNTEPAKQEAFRRAEFMRKFLHELSREVNPARESLATLAATAALTPA